MSVSSRSRSSPGDGRSRSPYRSRWRRHGNLVSKRDFQWVDKGWTEHCFCGHFQIEAIRTLGRTPTPSGFYRRGQVRGRPLSNQAILTRHQKSYKSCVWKWFFVGCPDKNSLTLAGADQGQSRSFHKFEVLSRFSNHLVSSWFTPWQHSLALCFLREVYEKYNSKSISHFHICDYNYKLRLVSRI